MKKIIIFLLLLINFSFAYDFDSDLEIKRNFIILKYKYSNEVFTEYIQLGNVVSFWKRKNNGGEKFGLTAYSQSSGDYPTNFYISKQKFELLLDKAGFNEIKTEPSKIIYRSPN